MIFYPCYDIICLSFNLNVTDVMDLINEFAHKMQNVNSCFFCFFFPMGVGGVAALCQWGRTNQLDVICCPCRSRNI